MWRCWQQPSTCEVVSTTSSKPNLTPHKPLLLLLVLLELQQLLLVKQLLLVLQLQCIGCCQGRLRHARKHRGTTTKLQHPTAAQQAR
jgi:hypothetical protein